MKVTLLGYSDCGENLADIGASTCIGKHRHIPKNESNNHLRAAIASGHVSVIEHLPLTFLVEDVSRSLLAQITRHRHFSFSVQSQRYCEVAVSTDWYITPKSIKDTECEPLYHKQMDKIATTYQAMLGAGIPREDARMLLPNACITSFIVSMNARALVEAASKRLCNRAQWEIRKLFQLMTEQIKSVYPEVYKLAKPNCETIGCQESKPCQRLKETI